MLSIRLTLLWCQHHHSLCLRRRPDLQSSVWRTCECEQKNWLLSSVLFIDALRYKGSKGSGWILGRFKMVLSSWSNQKFILTLFYEWGLMSTIKKQKVYTKFTHFFLHFPYSLLQDVTISLIVQLIVLATGQFLWTLSD